MANLLNVLQQVSSNNVATDSSSKQIGANSAEGKELKNLFEQNLSENLENQTPVESDENADLAQVALAAGAVQGSKAIVDPKNIKLQPKTGEVELNAKSGTQDKGVAGKQVAAAAQATVLKNGMPVQNQLKTKAPVTDAQVTELKNAVNANGLKPVKTPVAESELATIMAGQDLMMLPEEQEFEVESLNVKTAAPKEASSKLSTADFLNLREISQPSAKPIVLNRLDESGKMIPLEATKANGAVLGMKAAQPKQKDDKQKLEATMSALAPAHAEGKGFAKAMEATVQQSSGQAPVLSKESIQNIGNQVNMLGQAKQDGEIKIRLRPDHLGELQMSVRTQGQQVSVQIKAQNSEAKKIIEDSLSSLREHLSAQNLSLASVDVVTQPSSASQLDQSQMNFDANHNFNQSTHQGGRNDAQDGSRQSAREYFNDAPSYTQSAPAATIRPRTVDSSRLDMIA